MKDVKDIAKSLLPLLNRTENPRLVYHTIINGQSFKYRKPVLENECKCLICNCTTGYVCINEPKISSELCWFCSNPECLSKSAAISKHIEKVKWIKEMAKINPEFELLLSDAEISHSKVPPLNYYDKDESDWLFEKIDDSRPF